jgi:branched-chain amino acid aminotransferase
VTLSSWQRVGPNVIPHAAKASGLYLNALLPGRDARAAGYDEALLLTADGVLADATGQNVFLVRDGVLMTPPLSTGILAGITRSTISVLAAEMGIEVRETTLIRSDINLADEIFLTSTAAEVVPVREVDGRRLSVGPIFENLRSAYSQAVHGELASHQDWVTPVNQSSAGGMPPACDAAVPAK